MAHQGFVKRVANRATYVTQMSLEEAQKLSVVREALESMAVEIASRRFAAGEVDAAKLETALEKMRAAAEQLDRVLFYEYDIAFHRELWRLTGNEHLEQALEQVVAPLFACFTTRATCSVKLL